MDKKVLVTESETVKFNGTEIEVKGETFDKPISKNNEHTFFTRIQLINKSDESLWGCKLLYFVLPMDKVELKKNVDHVAKNIENYERL